MNFSGTIAKGKYGTALQYGNETSGKQPFTSWLIRSHQSKQEVAR